MYKIEKKLIQTKNASNNCLSKGTTLLMLNIKHFQPMNYFQPAVKICNSTYSFRLQNI